jgi:hypothetical protein
VAFEVGRLATGTYEYAVSVTGRHVEAVERTGQFTVRLLSTTTLVVLVLAVAAVAAAVAWRARRS